MTEDNIRQAFIPQFGLGWAGQIHSFSLNYMTYVSFELALINAYPLPFGRCLRLLFFCGVGRSVPFWFGFSVFDFWD